MAGIPAGPQNLTPASSQELLAKARADAFQSLREAQPGIETQPQTGIHRYDVGVSMPGEVDPASYAPEDFVPSAPPAMPPPHEFVAAPPAVEPTVGGFLKESFANTPSEIGNGVMRGFVALGRSVALLGGGAGAKGWDEAHSLLSGHEETGAQDAVFNAIKDHVDTAYNDWQADQSEQASGGAAQALGQVSEIGPSLLVPGAEVALPAMVGVESAKSSIDQGQDMKTAATIALVASATTAIGMKLPMKNPNIVKRIAAAIPGQVALTVSSEALTKKVLNDSGYKEAAAQIDPTSPETMGGATLMAAIFAAMTKGQKPAAKPGAKPAEPPPLGPAGTGAPPPPPGTAPMQPAPKVGEVVSETNPMDLNAVAPEAPKAAEPVAQKVPPAAADQPTAEPIKDLAAQILDMHDPKTPRKGVYLSADNVKALGGLEGVKDQFKGSTNVVINNFDKKGGALIVQNTGDKVKAFQLRKAEPDMQKVLGRLTGAGEGKPAAPDAVVVQGQTPEGAVAKESLVAPAEAPAKVAEVQAEGKTPVVTTPEAALARRETEIAKEPRKGIVKLDNGKEAAVHIEGEHEGKVVVRPLDENGEPTSRTLVVEQDRLVGAEPKAQETSTPVKEERPVAQPTKPAVEVKAPPVPEGGYKIAEVGDGFEIQNAKGERQGATRYATRESAADALSAITPEAAPTPAPKAAKPRTAYESLPEVLAGHEAQETPAEGKKFAGSLRDRQDNASAFAEVLKEAVKSAPDNTAPELLARAARAAKAAENLTLKSKEATEKGQGTSHARVSAIVAEMHKAARLLMGKAKAGDEVPAEAPKAAALKKRIEAAKERSEKPPVQETRTEPKAERVEVPVNPKYRDQVVPKRSSASDQLRAKKLMGEYVQADEADAPKHRKMIEAFLKESRPDVTQKEIDEVLNFVDEQRREQNPAARPRRMSDTVEEESTEFDRPETGFDTVSRPSLADEIKAKVFKNKEAKVWKETFENMDDNGFWNRAVDLARTGQHVGAQYLMDQIVKHTADPTLKAVLAKIRQHVPDLPVYFTNDVKKIGRDNTVKSLDAGGLFDPRLKQVQVRVGGPDAINTRTLQSIVHELVHAATAFELQSNPNGGLFRHIEDLRRVAARRAANRLGADVMFDHLAYFSGQGKMPAVFDTALYGLHNVYEFVAESMTNPRFQQLLAESERYRSKDELPFDNLGAKEPSLLTRLFRVIAKWMGVENPTLLDHIMQANQALMERQSSTFGELFDKTNADFVRELPDIARRAFGTDGVLYSETKDGLMALRDEPPPVQDDLILRQIAGEEATKTARSFVHIFKSKAWDALRKNGIAFLSADQIYRGNRRFFGGAEDPMNPLRQLEEADIEKNKQLNRMMERAKPVAEERLKLAADEDKRLGQLQIDATMWKIDPTVPKDKQVAAAKDAPKFDQRYDEFAARYNKLSDTAKRVFEQERDYNKWAVRELRKAGVETALGSYGANQITDAQKALLYGARSGEAYDSLIGTGKLIDVGDSNEPLKAALKDFAGLSELEGPYFHLGRQGDYVVQAEPEGTRSFPSRERANVFADVVRELGPSSKAKVSERGGEWVVDYNAQYVSMHEGQVEAEAAAQRMRDAGFKVGAVTQKTLGRENAPLSAGMKDLVAEAERRINKSGSDEATDALVKALRSSFLQMTAARSSYAGSRLARKNVGGVKPEDMRRNFAEHAQSTAWHVSQLRSVFAEAAALAKVRSSARQTFDVDQGTAYRRGRIVAEIGRRMQQEVRDYGVKAPFNAATAKLGFMAYLASPAHAMVNMTQNFTAGIPVAAARWGTARSFGAFTRGMKTVIGPAFISTMKASFTKGGTASDVHRAIIEAVRKDPVMGKWAKGENSPLQQLIDRGVISHSYSNELGAVARGDSARVARVFEWARLLPNMADAFNRVSTALAGLELTKGDVRKTADFVNEVHIDYSQSNKPRAFKGLSRVWGGNAVTMFKTYVQGMAHLTYSNLLNSFRGPNKAEAAKTLAGLLIANVLYAGVWKGGALEPLKLAIYAWNKVFGDDDEYHDPQNAMHQFLVEHMGEGAGNVAAYGVPHALGFDLSSRMGLSDLFLHDPPDLLTADKDVWANFMFQNIAGPPGTLLANNVAAFNKHLDNGEPFQAVGSLIPIRQYQDAVKAFQLYTQGKQNSLGGTVTQPSALDATYQLLGFRPAAVAKYQEKVTTAINYQQFIKDRKNAIVREYLTSDDPEGVLEKVQRFNEANPGAPLTVGDFLKLQRAKQRSEMEAAGEPGRDPALNEMLDY